MVDITRKDLERLKRNHPDGRFVLGGGYYLDFDEDGDMVIIDVYAKPSVAWKVGRHAESYPYQPAPHSR